MPPLLHSLLFLVFFLGIRCLGILVNSTIDDSFPDPRTGATFVYTPASGWNVGGSCEGCTARPDATLLYNNSWHDTTFYPDSGISPFPNTPVNASVEFTGSAIYVYCALARTTTSPTGNSDMSFFIDGFKVGEFVQLAPGSPGYDYDVLVYKNTSIPEGKHTFLLQNGRVDGVKALVMLDRIVYSYEDGVNPQSKPPLGAIIGGTLGGVAVLCILAIGLGYWYMKHKQTRARKNAMASGAPQLSESARSPLDAIPYTLSSPTYSHPHTFGSSRTETASVSALSGQNRDRPPAYFDSIARGPVAYYKKG